MCFLSLICPLSHLPAGCESNNNADMRAFKFWSAAARRRGVHDVVGGRGIGPEGAEEDSPRVCVLAYPGLKSIGPSGRRTAAQTVMHSTPPGLPVIFGKCCESSVGRDGSLSRPSLPNGGGFGETALPLPKTTGTPRHLWTLGVWTFVRQSCPARSTAAGSRPHPAPSSDPRTPARAAGRSPRIPRAHSPAAYARDHPAARSSGSSSSSA